MSEQTARNIWEFDRTRNRGENARNIADDIKRRISALSQTQGEIESLRQEVVNASGKEMELRREIRELKERLAKSETREGELEKKILKIDTDSSNDPKGYFKILGLDPEAFNGLSENLIEGLLKKNYHFSSFRNHPDQNNKCTPEEMQLLNEAYHFFMNAKNRIEYCQQEN